MFPGMGAEGLRETFKKTFPVAKSIYKSSPDYLISISVAVCFKFSKNLFTFLKFFFIQAHPLKSVI